MSGGKIKAQRLQARANATLDTARAAVHHAQETERARIKAERPEKEAARVKYTCDDLKGADGVYAYKQWWEVITVNTKTVSVWENLDQTVRATIPPKEIRAYIRNNKIHGSTQ